MTLEAITKAIQEGDVDAAERLVARNPKLKSARDDHAISLVMKALYHRQPEIASILADERDDLDLFEAVSLGRLDRAQEILEKDPKALGRRSADGFTALHYAAFFGRPEAAELLIGHGAAVSIAAENPMRVHPIHSASAINQIEICRQLLEAGADPDAQQHGGYTALMSAAMHGNQELVRLLLEHGADPAIESDDGKNAAAFAREKEHVAVAELLEGKS